jgi:hypothetical protein
MSRYRYTLGRSGYRADQLKPGPRRDALVRRIEALSVDYQAED